MKYKSVRKMISVCLVVLFSMTFACPVFAVSEEHEQSQVSTFHYGFAEQVAAPLANYASGEL